MTHTQTRTAKHAYARNITDKCHHLVDINKKLQQKDYSSQPAHKYSFVQLYLFMQ